MERQKKEDEEKEIRKEQLEKEQAEARKEKYAKQDEMDILRRILSHLHGKKHDKSLGLLKKFLVDKAELLPS